MTFITQNTKVKIPIIEERVNEIFGTKSYQIRSEMRSINVVRARYMIWYILRNVLCLHLNFIGSVYGRHHTTVMYGIRSFESSPLFNDLEKLVHEIMKDERIVKLDT